MRMEKELRLLRDEMEKERRVKEALVEERDTWKDMFLKALKSMEGLEKEIAQNESEIANLKSQLQAAASEKVIFLLHYSS
jgi:predicted  nucleic acid-binding Zn-ribbon protein